MRGCGDLPYYSCIIQVCVIRKGLRLCTASPNIPFMRVYAHTHSALWCMYPSSSRNLFVLSSPYEHEHSFRWPRIPAWPPYWLFAGVAAAGKNFHVRTGTKGILLRAVTPMLSYFGSIFAFTRIVMIARDYRKLKVLLGPTFKVLLGWMRRAITHVYFQCDETHICGYTIISHDEGFESDSSGIEVLKLCGKKQ